MLCVSLDQMRGELLVSGHRTDYEHLADAVRRVIGSGLSAAVPVKSSGATLVSHFEVQRGPVPNRVSYTDGRVVVSVAPALREQFLSFIEFPADQDLPDSPIGYHHHYDGLADAGSYVAPDSLPVVFGLERV